MFGQPNPAVYPLVKSKATFRFEFGLVSPNSYRNLCVSGFLELPEQGIGTGGGHVLLPLAKVMAMLLSPKVWLTSCLVWSLGRIGVCSGFRALS